MWPLSSSVRPLTIRLAIFVVAVLALCMRAFYAISDGALLTFGFLIPAMIDVLFIASSFGLAFSRPLVSHSFWRIIFLVLAGLTAVTLGVLGPFVFIGALAQEAGGLQTFGPLLQGVVVHLLLLAGLYFYVYRSPVIWSSRDSSLPGKSGTMA